MASIHPSILLLLVVFVLFLSTACEAAVKPNPASQRFLDENAEKPGVVTLESGLQYKILKRGTGNYRLKDEDQDVKVNWLGYKINRDPYPIIGDEKTNTIDPAGLIPGWREALMMMVEGDFWELYIPPQLSKQLGTDVTGDVLIFEMELVEIVGEKVAIYTCQISGSDDDSANEGSEGCSEKEQAYIAKTHEWDSPKVEAELQRLEKLLNQGGHKMKADAQEWFGRRLYILRQRMEKGLTSNSNSGDPTATNTASNSEGEL
mmetsp:Transcript_57319/g.86543  ORF Transcript_57319/g.86543 Transcript_57319/m.86543 type:complete len:261 (-) Transcript_57319:34-816(-)